MHPADMKRRERFVAFVRGRYGDAVTSPRSEQRLALQRKLARSKGWMTQAFDPEQPFGQRKASYIATRLGLPADAFEHDAMPKPKARPRSSAIPSEWVAVYQALLSEEREYVMSLAKMRLRARGIDIDRLLYAPDERAERMAQRMDVVEDELLQEEGRLQGPVRGPDSGPRHHPGTGISKGHLRGRAVGGAGEAKGRKKKEV